MDGSGSLSKTITETQSFTLSVWKFVLSKPSRKRVLDTVEPKIIFNLGENTGDTNLVYL